MSGFIKPEILKATAWGFLTTFLLGALIVIGSRNLSHFDAALIAQKSDLRHRSGGNHPMKGSRLARHQRKTIVAGILSITVIIVVLQLWLFTATMNAYLGGDNSILLPAALASLIYLGLNLGLLRYVYALEK